MSEGRYSIPGLMEGGRSANFLLLLLITFGEVVAQVLAAATLKAVLIGVAEGPFTALVLATTGLMAAAFGWQRNILGERFGLDYVNSLRRVLAHHAITVASSGGPGRFGTIAIRMTGDLAALKDWANKGVCGGLAGVLGLAGALLAAWIAAGAAGLAATVAGPILALILCSVFFPFLLNRIAERRRDRGRLSARIGDMLLWAGASAAYGAERRAMRPVTRAGEDVLDSGVREVTVSGLMLTPALLTLPLGAAAAVLLDAAGLSLTDGPAGWAALLFALSLAALATGMLAMAVAQFAERRIAMARLEKLMTDAAAQAPAAPGGAKRLPPGKAASLRVDGVQIVTAGEHAVWSRAAFKNFLGKILTGAHGAVVDDLPAEQVSPKDWARRVAYAGPARPLPRGRVTSILAAKHRAQDRQMKEALEIAGLTPDWLEQDLILDPHDPDLDEWTIARLRLTRALAHRPRILITDDAWLLCDPSLIARVLQWSRRTNTSLVLVTETGCGFSDQAVPSVISPPANDDLLRLV